MTGGVRSRIVSAIVVALAILPSLMLGADLETGPCLSASKTLEYQAWSRYGTGVFLGGDGKHGKELKDGIYRALLLDPTNANLRMRWKELCLEDAKSGQEAIDLCRCIYEAAPDDAGNVIFYVLLLWQNERGKEALDVLKKSLKLTGWKDGALLAFYAFLDEERHHEGLFERIKAARESKSCRNANALDLCEAQYWKTEEAQAATRLVKEGKGATDARRKQLVEAVEKSKAKALGCLKQLDCRGLDDFSLMSACGLMLHYEQWKMVKQVLSFCDDSAVRRVSHWWVDVHIRLFRETGDMAYFKANVMRCDVWMLTAMDTVRAIISILLKKQEFWPDAITLQKAIVIATGGDGAERMTLARLLAAMGKFGDAWKCIAKLDVEAMGLDDRMFRDAILVSLGKVQDAYEDYASIMLQSRLKLKYRELPPLFFYRYSMVCFKLGKKEQTLELAKACHDMAPDEEDFCNYYGYLLADYGQELPLAEELIRKALSKQPDNVAYIDSLAWVFFRRGEYEKALEQMVRVVEAGGLEGEDPDGELHDHLMQIFSKLQMPRTAAIYGREAEALKGGGGQ